MACCLLAAQDCYRLRTNRCKRDMQKKREIMHRQVNATLLTELSEDIHPVLRRVYASRGVGSAELTTSLSAMLPVSQLENTDAAAARLAEARQNNERVLVVGDFDADGATATALMMTCLRAFGFSNPDYLVPDREKYGYGLSVGLVEKALESAPGLLVTVDNGISSLAGFAPIE